MKKRNSGFTLIEFAICSVVVMTILGGAFTLLHAMFKANGGVTQVMQTQQNIRVAMNTIARDIIMAGTGLPTGGIAVPSGDNSMPLVMQGVGGTLTTTNNAIAILAPGNGSGPTVNGVVTDTITVTSINQESPTWNVAAISDDGTQIDFNQEVRNGPFQLVPGDLLVFTNSNGSVFGCVTDVSMGMSRAFFADDDAMGINQPTAASGNIQSLQNDDMTYPPTTATRVNILSYYISNTIEAHPKLMRVVNAQAPQAIVEDIENLQFSFDLFDFTTNEDTANQASTDSPNQIKSVSVSLSGRSPKVMTQSNKFFRFSLVSKVNVRNATFRNRYTGT